jgi:hypothetical protein
VTEQDPDCPAGAADLTQKKPQAHGILYHLGFLTDFPGRMKPKKITKGLAGPIWQMVRDFTLACPNIEVSLSWKYVFYLYLFDRDLDEDQLLLLPQFETALQQEDASLAESVLSPVLRYPEFLNEDPYWFVQKTRSGGSTWYFMELLRTLLTLWEVNFAVVRDSCLMADYLLIYLPEGNPVLVTVISRDTLSGRIGDTARAQKKRLQTLTRLRRQWLKKFPGCSELFSEMVLVFDDRHQIEAAFWNLSQYPAGFFS